MTFKTSRKTLRFINFNLKLICLILILVLLGLGRGLIFAQGTCVPTSVTACANVDDVGTLFIDGITIGTYNLAQGTSQVSCITTSDPTLLSALSSTTNNVVGVEDQNTSCCIMLAAWSVNINCLSGQVIDLSTDSGNISVWGNQGSGVTVPPGTGTWNDPNFRSGNGLDPRG